MNTNKEWLKEWWQSIVVIYVTISLAITVLLLNYSLVFFYTMLIILCIIRIKIDNILNIKYREEK